MRLRACVRASKRVCIIYHPRNVFSPLSICIYLQLLSEVATQEVKTHSVLYI